MERQQMRAFGILFAIVIVIGLGAVYSQRDRFFDNEPNTAISTKQIRDAEQANAAQVSDLQKQVKDLSQSPGQQEIADLKNQLAAEQSERKMLSDQLGALSARVDGLVKANASEQTSPHAPTAQLRRR